jgi:hypothetical protein
MVSTFFPKVYGNDRLLKTIKDPSLKKESEFRMHVWFLFPNTSKVGWLKRI